MRSGRIVKPRLHEGFFACDGDAIFLKLSRRQREAKIACVATLWRSLWFSRKKFNSLNFSRFFSAIFSSVASPVRGWLHMRFSLRAGDATILKKLASPSQAKNRSCSRGLRKQSFHKSWPITFTPQLSQGNLAIKSDACLSRNVE